MENQPLVLQAPPFHVPFVREGDRFTHQLLFLDGTCLLTSVSASSDAAWPPDPPIQQLVLEDIAANGKTAALGVGMSGYGHWSLAAEPVSISRPGVRWDWACKIHRSADWLGSTYRIDSSIAFEVLPLNASTPIGKQLRLRLQGGILSISTEAGRIDLDEPTRTIRMLPDGEVTLPGTYRWCYTIVIE